jgi:NAD(P)-dependent dehydrogenase (short-subunit alcohol dehydrogenase family)
MRIDGVGALVTGGASGLGEATVRQLAAKGARCTVFDRDEARSRALVEELGGGASYVAGDVGDPVTAAAAVAQAGEGALLRITVNCAGIAWVERTISRDGTPHDLDAFKRLVAVNLVGTFNVMRLAAAAMSQTEPLDEGERGLIVNTASVAAFEGQTGQVAYSATKGGIVGMTVPVARDLSPVGIRVNAIAPGLMETPLLAQLPEPAREALAKSVPFPHRLGRAGEFAQLVVAMAENPYLNGEVVRLDGALRMPPK